MERQQWFRTRGGRAGPTRIALDSALNGADLPGSRLITAEVARAAADLVDSARMAQDARLWLSASTRLLQLVAALGLEPSGDGVGAGPTSDDPAGLAAFLGGAAEVGDPSEP